MHSKTFTYLLVDDAGVVQTPKGRSDLAAQIGQNHFDTVIPQKKY